MCKRRWYNIKHEYWQFLEKQSKTQTAQLENVKYEYEEQLKFLLPFLKPFLKDTRSHMCNFNLKDNDEMSTAETASTTSTRSTVKRDDNRDSRMSHDEESTATNEQHDKTATSSSVERDDNRDSRMSQIEESMARNEQPHDKIATGSSVLDTSETRATINQVASSDVDSNSFVDNFLAVIAPTLKSLNLYYLNIAKSKIFSVVQKMERAQMKRRKKRKQRSRFGTEAFSNHVSSCDFSFSSD
ncbi:uncharacterized protein LOC105840407 [Monomorium pharaonis]|uniref:uncharacterized protein LOC105840407 n=1 Tax=Monomorium pharaonis TaxID=307658 RepID=UPI00063FC44D|nr:uncharacterized protein LOC105840407 [Monomorium pharaonis]